MKNCRFPLLAAAAVTAGCIVDPADDRAVQAAPLIGAGVQNCAYPEVGDLIDLKPDGTVGHCTATLVAPDMIVSAAHCFDYVTDERGAALRFGFAIDGTCETRTSLTIPVIRVRSFVDSEADNKSRLYIDDVAVAQLAHSVPSAVASPMDFSVSLPARDVEVTDVGIGTRDVTSCRTDSSDGQKGVVTFALDYLSDFTNQRKLTSQLNTTVCEGDSGGPVFVPATREIFWVNASSTVTATADPPVSLSAYGELFRHVYEVDQYMASWSCPDGVWWDHKLVDKDEVYPYARVCGEDGHNYECTPDSHDWHILLPGSCGDPRCSCANGAAYGDVAIPAGRTTCGSTVCGRDQLVYTCGLRGWQADLASFCGPPRVIEDLSTMPAWNSTVDASWGGAATWKIVSGGQSGTALRATRGNNGSSARVRVYPIAPNHAYTASVYMRVTNTTGDFWAETGFRLGSFTANDFDSNPAQWTLIEKFDKTTGGNGNAWIRYAVTFTSGASTQISVGFKLGKLSGKAPTVLWDTLRIE